MLADCNLYDRQPLLFPIIFFEICYSNRTNNKHFSIWLSLSYSTNSVMQLKALMPTGNQIQKTKWLTQYFYVTLYQHSPALYQHYWLTTIAYFLSLVLIFGGIISPIRALFWVQWINRNVLAYHILPYTCLLLAAPYQLLLSPQCIWVILFLVVLDFPCLCSFINRMKQNVVCNALQAIKLKCCEETRSHCKTSSWPKQWYPVWAGGGGMMFMTVNLVSECI